jgi:hypothetical protein
MMATHRLMQIIYLKKKSFHVFVCLIISLYSKPSRFSRTASYIKKLFILLLWSLFLEFKYTKLLRGIVLQEVTALKSNL